MTRLVFFKFTIIFESPTSLFRFLCLITLLLLGYNVSQLSFADESRVCTLIAIIKILFASRVYYA